MCYVCKNLLAWKLLTFSFKLRNFTHRWPRSGIFFLQIRALFSSFRKGAGETSPLPLLVTHLISETDCRLKIYILMIHPVLYVKLMRLFRIEPLMYVKNGSLVILLIFLSIPTSLTHFSPVSQFYTRWKRQKTKGFLTFSGGIEMWH